MTPRTVRHLGRVARAAIPLFLLAGGPAGCAYFNTLHNARAKFAEAQQILDKADPERQEITKREETLYEESFEKAARVVKVWPDSKWVDDALLLMGRASYEKGDYSTAARKFDEILRFFPDSNLTEQALLNKARTHVATREYPQAQEALARAEAIDDKDLRADVKYFSGRVREEQGEAEAALSAYADVVANHHDSRWFADAGMRAGRIAQARDESELAVSFFGAVQDHGRTPLERFHGGMNKGEVLVELGEWRRAEKAFAEVADRSTAEDDQSNALFRRGKVAAYSGDPERATKIWEDVLERYPRREGAASSQLAIAQLYDQAGDFEKAKEQYDLVREQGTGHPAWLEASQRMTEIDRVLALREEIASDEETEKERKRFLLAEQLLERIGHAGAALTEYELLASDSFGTEWGAKALYAQAWVLEHRLDEPDEAEKLLHRLANYYAGTEVDATARRRLGYPVWRVEIVDPGTVVYVRREGDDGGPEEIARNLIAPRDVPLPAGTPRVKVWARLHVADDGSVERVKIVKSGGEEFDAAVTEAAMASTFLPPAEGGVAITVIEYRFPPEKPGRDRSASDGSAPGEDAPEPSAAERDAALDAQDAGAPGSGGVTGEVGKLPPGVSLPPLPGSEELVTPESLADSLRQAADSSRTKSTPSRRLRGRDFDPTTAD